MNAIRRPRAISFNMRAVAERNLFLIHEDYITMGVLLVFFTLTSGLINLMLGISTRPYSDHFVQAFFAMISCASGYGCIALMQSTKVFHDDDKSYSHMIIGGSAITFVFLACSLALIQFFEDEASLRLLD